MDAQEPRPAEDATTSAEKVPTTTEAPVKTGGFATTLRGWMCANIWRKDGRKRDHIPDLPVWIGVIRVFQFALCVATIALTAYGTANVQRALNYRRITNWSGAEGYPLSWFTFSWSFCYLVWLGSAVLLWPMMYNCWVQLGLELLTLVFWIITASLLASHTDDLDDHDEYVSDLGPAFKKYQQDIQEHAQGFVVATFAATGTTAVNAVLFIITLLCFGRALHTYRLKGSSDRDSEKAVSPADPDKIIASPQMSGASTGQPPWAQHHHYHHYSWYGPPHHQHNGQPPQNMPPQPPYPYMPGYYPPPGQPYPPQQQGDQPGASPTNGQPPYPPPPPHNPQTPYAPPSPWSNPSGSTWPQHRYDLYQQQVPIAAQHTGQSGDYGSPQFPVVAPVTPSKSGLDGSTPTPLYVQSSAPPRRGTASPAELQSGVPGNESELPAELPPHDTPPRNQGQTGPDAQP